MDTIPATYWMIVIGVLSALFGLILYYVAMLVKEGTGAVSDSRELIRNSNKIVQDSAEIVSTLKGTVNEVNEALVVPARNLGNTFSALGSFFSGIFSKKE